MVVTLPIPHHEPEMSVLEVSQRTGVSRNRVLQVIAKFKLEEHNLAKKTSTGWLLCQEVVTFINGRKGLRGNPSFVTKGSNVVTKKIKRKPGYYD